jgi:hypothetical protein
MNENNSLFINDADPDNNYFNNLPCINNILNCNYLNEFSFKKKYELPKVNNKNFSIIHTNIRSAKKNLSNFENYLANIDFNPSIIALSETWFNDSDVNIYGIEGYNIESTYRPSKRGGGVSLLIRESLKYNKRMDLSLINEHCELIFIEIKKDQFESYRDILIGVMYRPPNGNLENYNNYLNDFLEIIKTEEKLIYICGDFNINLLNSTTHTDTDNFLNCLYSNSLFPLISKPTRISKNSATLIDNIFTNDINNVNMTCGILCTDISDHFPIFCIQTDKNENNTIEYITKRNFNNENINKFIHDLNDTDWHEVYNINEAQAAFSYFYNKYCTLFNKNFPIKKIKKGYKNRKPWLSESIKNAIIKKNKLYVQTKRDPSNINISNYKNYKSNLNRVLRYLERNYYQDLLIKNKVNLKKSWQVIKMIINKNKNSTRNTEFRINNKVICDENIIANSFNKFFINIGPNLAEKIPKVQGNINDYINYNPNSIFINDIESNEIKKIIEQLKDASPGYDGISPKILKRTYIHYLEPLKYIFQLSFNQGIFPNEMKLAKVIPIYKNGDVMEINNYRPVSVLSSFSKILEKLMYKRCVSFLNDYKLLYELQFGFREKYNTNLAMIHLIDKISTEINDNNFVLGLFIDLRKAFDTVNHEILLKKLHYHGIRGISLKWFESYLKNRKQYVQFNNKMSEEQTIKCGVPQGSILGPLLFILYMNDFSKASTKCTSLLFADDTNIFMSGKNLNDLIKNMNNEISKIVKWLNINKLSLNIEKTNYMIFRSPSKNINKSENIRINNISINEVNHTKFLGVILDNKLIWNDQIRHIRNKISKGIGILVKCKKYFNESTLKMLYYSFIYPHLSYCRSMG